MAKKKVTKKQTPADKEKETVEFICKNVDMILSSVKITQHLTVIMGLGPDVMLTTMGMVVHDFIEAMASATDAPKEALMNDFLDAVKKSIKED